jgi:hypothetical protein
VVTTDAISDKVYTVGDTALIFNFNDWSENMGTCTPFVYTSTLSSGAVLPGFISFTPATKGFSISSVSVGDAATY